MISAVSGTMELPCCQRSAITAMLGSVLLVVVGCGWEPPGKPRIEDRPLRPDQVLDYSKLFAQNCTGCHGKEGLLGPAPPLQDSLFLAILSPEELRAIVVGGRPGTMMPPFAKEKGGHLTTEQIQVIVDGIYKEWGKGAPTGTELPKYVANEAGNAEAGAAVFANACASCHGAEGKGGEKAGALNDLAFLGITSDQMIRRVVITGRPDLGMPDFRRASAGPDAKPLTNQEISDVVAYLSSWRAPSTGKSQ